MRKNKFLYFYVMFLVLTLSGCANREIKNLHSLGQGIICFGDSITFGYGVIPGEDYPTQLSKILNMPVINAGVDGDTSLTALSRLESEVLVKNPFLVIVEFSGNDFLKKLPMPETIKSINEIVERIQAKGAIVAVADISAGMFLTEYRAVLAKIAREKGAIFIPQLLNGIITTPNLKSDFIHPNAQGYKIVAQRVYRGIRPYLNQK